MAVMNEAQTAAYIAEEKKYYTFEVCTKYINLILEQIILIT